MKINQGFILILLTCTLFISAHGHTLEYATRGLSSVTQLSMQDYIVTSALAVAARIVWAQMQAEQQAARRATSKASDRPLADDYTFDLISSLAVFATITFFIGASPSQALKIALWGLIPTTCAFGAQYAWKNTTTGKIKLASPVVNIATAAGTGYLAAPLIFKSSSEGSELGMWLALISAVSIATGRGIYATYNYLQS